MATNDYRAQETHTPEKNTRVAEFNRQKSNLEENEALIQCDYSENYKNREQDEVQSAYFGHASFSIFTACAYFRSNEELIKHPMTIVSEASDHSRIHLRASIKWLEASDRKWLSLCGRFLCGVIAWRRYSARVLYSSF